MPERTLQAQGRSLTVCFDLDLVSPLHQLEFEDRR